MQEPSALGRIVELVRDLRSRCPWCSAQSPQTLRPYLVEEVLELDHALGSGDETEVRAELGDVLLHVAYQIVFAEERGAFGAEDLTGAVERKMRRRHPKLFPSDGNGDGPTGAEPALDHQQVAARWERLKVRERDVRSGVLDGLPPSLPPLIMARRLQERAAGVGFDWPDVAGPLAKVREELGELETVAEGDPDRLREEVGDLLFAVVNVARKLGSDPRAALEDANERFRTRFARVEALAEARGIDIATAGLAALDALWDEVKRAR